MDTAVSETHGFLRSLQQMRADTRDLLGQDDAGRRNRSTRHRHAARCKSAHAIGRHRTVAMPDDDILDGYSEFLIGDLSQGRFEPLSVILNSDKENEFAIRREAGERGLVA